MENREKTVKLLESFLSDKQVDGVCGYIVDPDGEGPIQVIVVLDIDYIKEANTKPGFIARMIRQGVKQEIEKWIGFDVYVGSTARKCEENITESISTYLRRRLSFEHMKQDIENLVDYELNPCEFSNIGDFVAEACDMLVYSYVEDLEVSFQKVSSREKDTLYYFLVDNFGNHLANVYKQRCVKGLGESKKTYVVTESQYKNLLEGSTEEESIEDSKRFYKMFKRIIDEKFSELTYDESPRWSTHEDDVAWKDSDEDVFRYNDYAFLVKRGFFWSLMNYLPISHNATKMMFERYFKEKFPNKFFLSVEEFDA
jgi:hypothetical protein